MRIRELAKRIAQLESKPPEEPWQMQGMVTVVNNLSRVMTSYTDIWVPRTGGMYAAGKFAAMLQILPPGETYSDKLLIEMHSPDVPYSGSCQLRVFNHNTGRGVVVAGQAATGVDSNYLGIEPVESMGFDYGGAIAVDGDQSAARAEFFYDPAEPGILHTAPGVLSIMGTFFGQALPPA